jgi:periplasmic protein TonB
MAYRLSQGAGPRRAIAIAFAVLLNVGFILGLQAGLIQKAISNIETKVEAVKEPPPPPKDNTPPPPPPPVEEPPPYVPPPNIVVATTTAPTTAIQQVTTTRPPPDRQPVGTNIDQPPYPDSSTQNCEEGVVGLTLSLDEHGKVVDVKLARTSGYPALDNSALNTAKHWRLSPARKDGKPYATDYNVNVKFELRDANKRAYDECRKAGKAQ